MIKLEGIYKTYGDTGNLVTALNNINLLINNGEFVSIMGASGSGKSTLMHIIGLLDKPSKGHYFLNDKDISDIKENDLALIRNREIGFVFQAFNLLPRTTVMDNVMLPLIYRGENNINSQNKAMQILDNIGIKKIANFKTNQISGGQQQRVAIARALMQEPSILLADEPTGNLDSKASEEIIKILQDLNNNGHTVILVTHEEDIANKAKRLIVLKDGNLLSDNIIKQHIL
ncbi:ABC transporter ATP-binding protein [Patescibacteria group bacterium]|nr:ABC transporter ATP-binding protein [Patescibacteria group bacterium]